MGIPLNLPSDQKQPPTPQPDLFKGGHPSSTEGDGIATVRIKKLSIEWACF